MSAASPPALAGQLRHKFWLSIRIKETHIHAKESCAPWVVWDMAEAKPSLVERLFAEHRAALLAFFRRRIRGKADAPDLAQEVYLRMLRISDQDAIRNPVLYLYTVANNLVKEHAVLDRRQANSIDIADAPPLAQLETLPMLEGDVDATQRGARLRAVLQQLRPKCRAAVTLRFTYGLSYREIGARLGVSPQMARKYVGQALGHCRRRMARMG
jgi:RNA polymerase sigma factor (sigma-70 family)